MRRLCPALMAAGALFGCAAAPVVEAPSRPELPIGAQEYLARTKGKLLQPPPPGREGGPPPAAYPAPPREFPRIRPPSAATRAGLTSRIRRIDDALIGENLGPAERRLLENDRRFLERQLRRTPAPNRGSLTPPDIKRRP